MLEAFLPYLIPTAVVTGLFVSFELLAVLHIRLFVTTAREVSVHDMFEVPETSEASDTPVSAPVHSIRR